jgi:hypothetical protein
MIIVVKLGLVSITANGFRLGDVADFSTKVQ